MTRAFYRRVAPLWLLVVVVGSFLPTGVKREMGTPVPFWQAQLNHVPVWHRTVHFIAFGGAAALLVLAARRWSSRTAAWLGVLALGLAIELAQNWLDQLGMEWWDVRDDSLAATAVFLLLLIPAVRNLFLATGER
jgi:hypothetical protein